MTERAFDPELTEMISLLPSGTSWGSAEDIPAAREAISAYRLQIDPRTDVIREDRDIPGREGDPDVSVRVYRPVADVGGPLAGLFEIHGGGFVVGEIDMMDGFCDRIAADFSAVVVSVGYRLAPEDPFPAGVNDCYAALEWFAAHADEFGVDPGRIAIAGQSAGGGLAAATALMARDLDGPALCFQLLEIPELDDRLDTPSMTEFVDTPMWNRPNAERSWAWYLGSDDLPGSPGVSPYAAPARAEDLSGLPPAFVSVMEFDPLRDEGIIYALRLLQAGVSTELHAYPGTFHGSSLVAEANVSKRATRDSFAALQRALTGQTRASASASSEPS